MKKLVLAFVLAVSSFINAQKITISNQYFNYIVFIDSIDRSELIPLEYDESNSTIILNLEIDLDQHLIKLYGHSIFEIDSVSKNGSEIGFKILNSGFYDFCKIYTESKTIIFYAVNKDLIGGMFATDYDSDKFPEN